jgi:Type I phosphodiesterase / nucleotide pyrophosphatase
MNAFRKALTTLLAACSLVAPAGYAGGSNDHGDRDNQIKHILLISIDGMHALDLSNYVNSHPDSTLAFLSGHGVTYTNNSTSSPSDSFPGLASLITGGSPATTGFWYDVTYNRGVSPPAQTTPFPITGGANLCPSVIGTPVAMDESIDFDLTKLDGGGGINSNFVPRDPQSCLPILPHQYLRVNTIFEVVRANGGRTAWVDKHPSYEWTNGPSGKGVQDFYGPEINSIPVPLPQYPGCNPVPFPDPGFDDGWTTDLNNIKCYDSLHVTAVLNQIDGFTHDRSSKPGIPTLFGMNFQAVSVGEKLAGSGYTDVLGTPSQGLAGELDFVDQSLGQMVSELKKTGHYDSTLIIISAKHGQSPIDVQKRVGIGGGQPATLIGASEAFDISDDGSLIWLISPSLTPSVVQLLSNPQSQLTLGIQEILALQSLENKYNSPLNDPRTPDIILKVNTGVIFTGGSKIAEHGGLNEDDVHTALLVSFPSFNQQTVKTPTSNQQVAPTILKLLGIDPNELQAVKKEQIKVLPFLFRDSDN